MENRIPLWCTSIDGSHVFHEFCKKLNSTEFMESKLPVEFGLPLKVDEFTLFLLQIQSILSWRILGLVVLIFF